MYPHGRHTCDQRKCPWYYRHTSTQTRNCFGDVDGSVRINMVGVSTLLAPKVDSVSVRLFPMTALAGLAGVFRIDPFHSDACYLCFVTNHLFKLVKFPRVPITKKKSIEPLQVSCEGISLRCLKGINQELWCSCQICKA